MAIDPRVRTLMPQFDKYTPNEEMLAHARQQAAAFGLDQYFVVDIDSHREPTAHWEEVLEYVQNPVMRRNAQHDFGQHRERLYVPSGFPAGAGHSFQSMHGRVPHQDESYPQRVMNTTVLGDVQLCRDVMDAMGIDVQIVFPTTLLGLAMAPLAESEAQIAYAYNRWMIERFCAQDSRLMFFPYLPMRSPEMALRIVREFAGREGVAGFLVTSVRFQPVHDNSYMRLYAEIEESGLPIAFHAGPTWDDQWMRTMNRFLSVHALSFVHCNMVHMTNWVINGLPERFPRLKVIWVESGLAWVPYLMQRLDHEYLKRTSEAPLLKKLPSDYMREMYYSSQPMESDNRNLLESTMSAIHAETQLLYASDWPHWDFDPPASIFTLDFLSDEAKRNILGLNAARVLNLDVPASQAFTPAP